jgi:electron transfer flavoprotein beta subunit
VPDTKKVTGQAMKADGTINRAALPAIFNPEDKNALEAALSVKERYGGKVIAVTMGLPAAKAILREALACGADEAVLVTDRKAAGSDTLATSYILSQAVRKFNPDLVFCGRQAIDGDTAQVGPQIAEKLHLPQVTYAGEIHKDGDVLTVKRILEDGYMTVKGQTPCMITCIKELNNPRYMSVGGVFDCYNKPLVTMTYETLKDHPLIDKSTIGLAGSPTNILTSFTPPQKGAGMMLEGAGKETTDKLAGILAAKHII